jgi:hypothetical protein
MRPGLLNSTPIPRSSFPLTRKEFFHRYPILVKFSNIFSCQWMRFFTKSQIPQLPDIIFSRTYPLGDLYDDFRIRADQFIGKYLKYPDLFVFNDAGKTITFSSERLIPYHSTNRPRVMLLFSNPHPFSVFQGMFLSPNTRGQENPFWSSMRNAGWMSFPDNKLTPHQLAEICLKAEYQGPFEFVFYCYYAFPTNYPEDICSLFGKDYFNQFISLEARDEFRQTINETKIEAVVTFNKEIFNRVSNDRIERYIDRLVDGEIIHSQISGIERKIPIFLTFPTGWIYHKDHKYLRQSNLERIREAISSRQL